MIPIFADIYDLFLSYIRFLNSLNIPLSVETICVFTAPIFSAFTSWATYLLTRVCIHALVIFVDFGYLPPIS